MGDPKLVEDVLNEPWVAFDGGDVRRAGISVPGPLVIQIRPMGNEPKCTERARQAALGHRALKLLARMRGDEADELFRWTGLAIGDADEAEAIIRELRGEP